MLYYTKTALFWICSPITLTSIVCDNIKQKTITCTNESFPEFTSLCVPLLMVDSRSKLKRYMYFMATYTNALVEYMFIDNYIY